MLRVGLCGTDAEINHGLFGVAPDGEEFLILGHQNFGVVEAVGARVKGYAAGISGCPPSSRPCVCPQCKAGENDMCSTGRYTQRGIAGGTASWRSTIVESPLYLFLSLHQQDTPEALGQRFFLSGLSSAQEQMSDCQKSTTINHPPICCWPPPLIWKPKAWALVMVVRAATGRWDCSPPPAVISARGSVHLEYLEATDLRRNHNEFRGLRFSRRTRTPPLHQDRWLTHGCGRRTRTPDLVDILNADRANKQGQEAPVDAWLGVSRCCLAERATHRRLFRPVQLVDSN